MTALTDTHNAVKNWKGLTNFSRGFQDFKCVRKNWCLVLSNNSHDLNSGPYITTLFLFIHILKGKIPCNSYILHKIIYFNGGKSI